MVAPLVLVLSLLPVTGQASGDVQQVARYTGQGGQFASAVAPGPTPGTERLYASYLYLDDTFEVLSIDPATGSYQVLKNPTPGEYGVRAMVAGPDGNVYVGTLPHAHLLRLDTRTQRLVDLGRPSSSEEFIWDLAFGTDGRLYGVTSPNAHLVRLDPRSGRLQDLGRLDPHEQMARRVATSADGFVYAGIGTGRMNVAAYRIADGERREILPAAHQGSGLAEVYRAADGQAYAIAGTQHFRLVGWEARPIAASEAPPRVPSNVTRGGRAVSLHRDAVRSHDLGTGVTSAEPFTYPGRDLALFRLALGPDQRLYASTMLPSRLLRLDEAAGRFEEVGELGDGEVYSFLALGGRLLMAAYSCGAPLLAYTPGKAFGAGPPANPARVRYPGDDERWRPLALAPGPDGLAYAGAIPGYGKLGGPLVAWDVAADRIPFAESVVKDQGISALTAWRDLIVGGTTVKGGSGRSATTSTAKIFVWDPRTRRMVFEVEVAGASSVDSLAVGADGLVYGLAEHQSLVFDPAGRAAPRRTELPFRGGTVYGALAPGPDGRLWGLGGHPAAGVFSIDPGSGLVKLQARPPAPITGGLAIRGQFLYFLGGSTLYRLALPTRTGG